MAPVDSYKGIIFDYGGVLVHHQTTLDQARLANIAGIPRETFSELYWADRADYDKAVLSGPAYWHSLGLKVGVHFTTQRIDDLTEYDTISWMHFDDEMFAWISVLRQSGKKLAVLSNMPQDLGEAIKTRTARFKLFDHVTLSYEVGAVKPEPAIYEHCLEGLGLSAQEVVFLDDRIENCHGAEQLGIAAVRFTSRDEVLPKLRSL